MRESAAAAAQSRSVVPAVSVRTRASISDTDNKLQVVCALDHDIR